MYYDHDMHPDSRPTAKQLSCIQMITDNTGIQFYGKTKYQAREFISQHIETSKNARSYKKEFQKKYYGNDHLNHKSENMDYDPSYDIDHRDDYNDWDSFENYIPY